jgi:hypothetical protein
MLVGGQVSQPRLHPFQPRQNRFTAGEMDAQRNVVDKRADHRVDARQLGRPAGNRGAKHDVALAAVARQEQCPAGVDRGAQGQLPLAQPTDERCSFFGRQVSDMAAISVLRIGRLVGPPPADWRGRQKTGKLGLPERFGRRCVLLVEPGDVIAETGRRSADVGSPGEEQAIGFEHLPHEDGQTPAVEKQMVSPAGETIAAIAQEKQIQTHQGRASQIDRLAAGTHRPISEASGLFVGGRVAPVVLFQGQVDLLAHHLERAVEFLPHDRRAQRRMPLGRALPGLVHLIDIEAPLERGAQLLDKKRASRVTQRTDQHHLLHARKRVDISNVFQHGRILPIAAAHPQHGRLTTVIPSAPTVRKKERFGLVWAR